VPIDGLGHAPLFVWLGLLIGLLPLAVGIWCAVRPSERALLLMRPLSLSAIFAATANLLLGLANAFHAWGSPPRPDFTMPPLGVLLAESLIPAFVGFAFLTIGWLSIAVGIRKPSEGS
jgi:hypothetical protein